MGHLRFFIGMSLIIAVLGGSLTACSSSAPPSPEPSVISKPQDPRTSRIIDTFADLSEGVEQELDVALNAQVLGADVDTSQGVQYSYEVAGHVPPRFLSFWIGYGVPATFSEKQLAAGELVEVAGLEGIVITGSERHHTGSVHRVIQGEGYVFSCEIDGWPASEATAVITTLLGIGAERLNEM